MAKTTDRLSDRTCRTIGLGKHHDGSGLYLSVRQGTAGLTRSWLFRYKRDDKQVWMGLGAYPAVGLSRAREKARDAKRLLADDHDPLAHRRAQRTSLSQQRAEQAKLLTFDKAADQYIAAHRPGWRSLKHARNWTRSLELYARPSLGALPVASIDTELVMTVLEPMWLRTPELASHLRGRIELILDWATASGYRTSDNPARWRGHLDKLLPAKGKVAPVVHHPALPYEQVPAFVAELRERHGTAARALEFVILTAARSGEVLGMKWGEVDFLSGLWTVPASRMKAGREHRVPLSAAAVALLDKLPRDGEHVFVGGRRLRLSSMAMHALLLRMKRTDITIHGFRSSFRDWCGEQTNYPREIAETALAHAVGDAVERAYARGDALEKRRALMTAWANYIDREPVSAEVVTLRA
jgi:integrase